MVPVRARSLLPYCHFELEDSDYIRNGRRNADLPGPAAGSAPDTNTRTIEFVSAGVGVGCSVKFDVINPTSQRYSFAWKCEDDVDTKQFVCHCSSGVINSGKKTQVNKCKLQLINQPINLFAKQRKIEVKIHIGLRTGTETEQDSKAETA